MAEPNLEDLRSQLSDLEAEELRLSATRKRLQDQIDFGFESGTTREREREVSEARRALHRRIESLRERLAE